MKKKGVQNDSQISDLKKKKVCPKKHLHAYRKIFRENTEKVIFEDTEFEMSLKQSDDQHKEVQI